MRTVNQAPPPPQDARTAIPLSGAILIGLYAFAAVGLAITRPLTALIVCGLFLWPIASDRLASWFSPHVVYMLYNEQRVIYVGETDDPMRRMYQHTDGIEHVWWREIDGFTIARHCWSDRQAKRIERRLIAVINDCSEHSWCDKLRNEIWDTAHTKLTTRLTLWWWKAWYLYASHCADCRAFHNPQRELYYRSIPARPGSAPGPDEPDGWRGGEPNETRKPTEATYERTPSNAPTPPLEMLALPPASSNADRNEPDRNGQTAPRRGVGVRDAQNRHAQDVTQPAVTATLSAKVRDAHRRHTEAVRGHAATLTADNPPAGQQDGGNASRKAMTNAERQKAWRERQKAKRQQQDRASVDNLDDRQARQGRGEGEGGQ